MTTRQRYHFRRRVSEGIHLVHAFELLDAIEILKVMTPDIAHCVWQDRKQKCAPTPALTAAPISLLPSLPGSLGVVIDQ